MDTSHSSLQCAQPLDESVLAIMNVFENTIGARSSRQETDRLRHKLIQYQEADIKKSNDLKAKNDDISALQKELSNTKHRFRDLKGVREQEVNELKEILELRDDEVQRLGKDLQTLRAYDNNYEKQLAINKKELDFLREQLEDARARIASFEGMEEKFNDVTLKEDLAKKMRRQSELEKAHGEIWRAEAQRVKFLEKELEREKEIICQLTTEARDKSVAIEKEKLWRSKIDRLQPQYDKLVEQQELTKGEFSRECEKVRRLEMEVAHARSMELDLVHQIGTVKSELSVEKSRHQSCAVSLSKITRQLESAKADISFTETAKQGDVDLSALNDEIKVLKDKNILLEEEIGKMRKLGAVQDSDNVVSYRNNPSFSRRKRPRESGDAGDDVVEVRSDTELKKKLHDATKKVYELEKTNQKIVSCIQEKINQFRDAVSEVLGYKVSTNDYQTFNFLSLFAQGSEDVIRFQRQQDEGGEKIFEMDSMSRVFHRPDISNLLEENSSLPILMSKTTIALSAEDTILL